MTGQLMIGRPGMRSLCALHFVDAPKVVQRCNHQQTHAPASSSGYRHCSFQRRSRQSCTAHSRSSSCLRPTDSLPQYSRSGEREGGSVEMRSSLDRARQALRPAAIAAVSLALTSSAQAASQTPPQLDLAAELSPKQAELLALVSRPALAIFIFLMLVRIVLTWYPNVKENKLPWSLATFPTEFFLGPTRRTFPPVGGVDIAPIIWLALFTFFNEILLGPQGILILLQRKMEI